MRAMPFRTRAAEPTLAEFLARLAREERNLHRRQRLRRAVPWLCLAALAALGAALF
jgi:hypothetical protein